MPCQTSQLDDPNDEAKLVERLKSYCARGQTLHGVFDRGLPGGPFARSIDQPGQVVFASAGYMSADQC
jgi:hypothetical protein